MTLDKVDIMGHRPVTWLWSGSLLAGGAGAVRRTPRYAIRADDPAGSQRPLRPGEGGVRAMRYVVTLNNVVMLGTVR